MSDWNYITVLVCTDKDAGNALANLAAAFPGDPNAELHTFEDSRMAAPNTDPSNPTVWWASVLSKPTMAGVISALKDRAPYSDQRLSYLIERGLTLQQWNMADAIFPYVEVFNRADVQGTDFVTPFLSSHGYASVEVES